MLGLGILWLAGWGVLGPCQGVPGKDRITKNELLGCMHGNTL